MLQKALIFLFLTASSLFSLSITPLSGGFSGALNYVCDCGDKKYVLKIYPQNYVGSPQAKQELLTWEKSSKKNISPPIFWISEDERVILVEFIEGKRFTTQIAKEKKNLIEMGKVLQQIHSLPLSTYKPKQTMELYLYLKGRLKIPKELDEAILWLQNHPQPENGPKVTLHGDLNPRNIFLKEEKIQLIDWSETSVDDPFYDLTCFSLLHNLTIEEETTLVTTYLEREMTLLEMQRYDEIKKINRIDLSVNLLFLAYSMNRSLINQNLLDFTKYCETFADSEESLSAQFFYDWGRSCVPLPP